MTKRSRSNAARNRLEDSVAQLLIDNGYVEFWNHKSVAFAGRDAIGGKQYLRKIPIGSTIYKTLRKADFLIVNRARFPGNLVLECRWQAVSGSVDEKYPFLLHNIEATGVPTILLLDGSGYKPAAMTWMKNQIGEATALKAVLTLSEFKAKVDAGFLG